MAQLAEPTGQAAAQPGHPYPAEDKCQGRNEPMEKAVNGGCTWR